jgi:hypothetical protein
MSVKLVLLKSGESVIADVKEMVSEDQKVLGYFLSKACIVELKKNLEEEDAFKITLFPWAPLTKTKEIPIPSDWVITIVDPIDKVVEMYERDVVNATEGDYFE